MTGARLAKHEKPSSLTLTSRNQGRNQGKDWGNNPQVCTRGMARAGLTMLPTSCPLLTRILHVGVAVIYEDQSL